MIYQSPEKKSEERDIHLHPSSEGYRMKRLEKKNIQDIYALTPLQEGMLFHYLNNPGSNHYFVQLSLKISDEITLGCFKKAWDYVVKNNEMLRALFRWEKLDNPTQVVLKQHNSNLRFFDLSSIKDHTEQQKQLKKIKLKDREGKFDLREVPFRIILCKIEECAEKNDAVDLGSEQLLILRTNKS